MRAILLLIALLIVAMLVVKQTGPLETQRPQRSLGGELIDTPVVPSSPGEVKNFEIQMDDFIKETSEQRAKELEESLNKH